MNLDPLWYVVIIGAAAILYAVMIPRQRKQQTGNQSEIVREVEETLEHFMDEIDQDNKELVQLVTQMKQDFVTQQNILGHRVEQLEHRCQQLELQLGQQAQQWIAQQQTSIAEEPIHSVEPSLTISVPVVEQQQITEPEPSKEDASIKGRYAEVFALYEDGKSIDMISKKTGIPSGEIQLILQLSKQEASRD
ncbi:DUF6115 domain-containing protein [Paenibacillus guangzhouensis]|uniref:DUF6115 domain-containing protein n=1 Tax=Paenibacillus guangzhouensis TaxID=1473112 RepID=UPI001266BEE6|nr:hypothetical protein [Paenibacillus guangzhouensis]